MMNDTIQERISVAARYLQNRRLREYREILSSAKKNGYQIVSVMEAQTFFKATKSKPKLFVLRHDVDYKSPATLQMGTIESELQATASYYFRWSTFEPKVMQTLVQQNHECSLHYETVANYYLAHHLDPKVQKVTPEIEDACRQKFKEELTRFKTVCGETGIDITIKTIAAHGHPINRVLKYRNNQLFLGSQGEKWLAGIMEAYNPTFLTHFQSYITDTSLRHNNGYRYGAHPIDCIKAGHRQILFVTHPNYWHLGYFQRTRAAAATVILGLHKTNEKFRYI